MKRLLTVLLAALMCFTLTACGSSSETTEDTTTEEEKTVLRVGMECNYAPFNWSTVDEGEYTQPIYDNTVDYADGYDVVMATKIAEAMGMKVEIHKLTWDALIPALKNGEIDLIIAGMTDTPEREEEISFTSPYYESQMTIIVRKNSDAAKVTDIQELKDMKVMGQLATTYDEIIDQIEGIGENHVAGKDAYPDMIPDLTNGIVDAITAEEPVAIGICAANDDLTYVAFEEGHGFDVDTSVSIGMRKEDDALREKVQAALDTISAEDRLQIMTDAVSRQPAVEE